MLTLDRIQLIDSALHKLMAALTSALAWAEQKHDALIVNCAYRVTEVKAKALGKAEDKLTDLEDERIELVAYGVEAQAALRDKFLLALEALNKEIAEKGDKIDSLLAAQAQALVAAEKDYEQTIAAAYDKLGVEVRA